MAMRRAPGAKESTTIRGAEGRQGQGCARQSIHDEEP
jgi:hypothetical protein